MRATLLVGGAVLAMAAGAEDAARTAASVTTFAVQVTNRVQVAVRPLEDVAPAPAAPAAVAETRTNAVTASGAVTNVSSLLLIDTNRMNEVVARAVADAARAVRDAAAASAAEQELARISTRTFQLRHASAEEVAERFNSTWSGDFGQTWKLVRIAQAFPDANRVMVTAPGSVLDACARTIREIDVAPRQVYIEARFVELASEAAHNLGIDWSMLNGMKGSVSFGGGIEGHRLDGGVQDYRKYSTPGIGGSGFDATGYQLSSAGGRDANITHFTGTLDFSQMYTVLYAIEGSGDARTFSNPKIIVASGRKATVDMTTKYPNVQIAAKKTINNNNESVDLDMKMAEIPGEDKFMFAKEAFFSWGISLEVTPRVDTNGLINVSIVPTISDCKEYVTAGTSAGGAGGNTDYSSKYPVIEVKRLVTEFSMASGRTAVIGGLSRTVEEQSDTGIPWLRDCPWIGDKFFGGKQRRKVQKEIIVFVTVGLVNPETIVQDAGLPKNAVMSRQYTNGQRKEPGDRTRIAEGVQSLDLRSLEEQARNPRWTNEAARISFPIPFTKRKGQTDLDAAKESQWSD